MHPGHEGVNDLHQYRIRPSTNGGVRLYLYKFGSLVRSLWMPHKAHAENIGYAWKLPEGA